MLDSDRNNVVEETPSLSLLVKTLSVGDLFRGADLFEVFVPDDVRIAYSEISWADIVGRNERQVRNGEIRKQWRRALFCRFGGKSELL
jgi:hypothetical protein